MTVLLYQQRSTATASAWSGLLPEPPLLDVAGKPLLIWHLEKLADAGVEQVVLSLPDPTGGIAELVGDGDRFGLAVRHVDVGRGAGSGIDAFLAAGAWTDGQPLTSIRADLWTDYDFARLPRRLAANESAFVVLVDNLEHHPHGDLALLPDGRVHAGRGLKLTFAGISVWSPTLRARAEPRAGDHADQPMAEDTDNPLADVLPMLALALAAGDVRGEHYAGPWTHLSRPERIWDLDGVLDM